MPQVPHLLVVGKADVPQRTALGHGLTDSGLLPHVPAEEAGMQQEDVTGLPVHPRGLAGGVYFACTDGAGTRRVEADARAAKRGVDVDEHRTARDTAVGPVTDRVACWPNRPQADRPPCAARGSSS